jgi:glucose-1-phosphate cytidylyltransferase
MLTPGEVLNYIKDDNIDWNQVLFQLNSEKQLRAFKHEGFWYSLETLKDKHYLEKLWNSGKAPWKVW